MNWWQRSWRGVYNRLFKRQSEVLCNRGNDLVNLLWFHQEQVFRTNLLPSSRGIPPAWCLVLLPQTKGGKADCMEENRVDKTAGNIKPKGQGMMGVQRGRLQDWTSGFLPHVLPGQSFDLWLWCEHRDTLQICQQQSWPRMWLKQDLKKA